MGIRRMYIKAIEAFKVKRVPGSSLVGVCRPPGKFNHDRAFLDELNVLKVKVIGRLLVFGNCCRVDLEDVNSTD